jgi:hypothetical protein
VPDRCGPGEDALGGVGTDAFDAATVVQFKVEMAVTRNDRFDRLTDRV